MAPRVRRTPAELAAQKRAGMKVRALVKAGKMPAPATCVACGRERGGSYRIVYHHWRGYDPETGADTDCVALCDPCHRDVHLGSIPEPRTGRVRDDIRGRPMTAKLRGDVLRAHLAGRDWTLRVSAADFVAVVAQARSLGLGSVERGFAEMRENHGIWLRKRELANLQWIEECQRRAEVRRREKIEAAMLRGRGALLPRLNDPLVYAQAVARYGSPNAAIRELRVRVGQDVRRRAKELGYLRKCGPKQIYIGPPFDGSHAPAPAALPPLRDASRSDLGGEPVIVINNPRKQRPAHRRSA